jgi:LAO/AO transport system kinase
MTQFKGALSLRGHGRAKVPVLRTTATTGEGIVAVAEAIAELGALRMSGDPRDRRRRRARYLIARAAADLIAERVRSGERSGLDKLADAVLTGRLSPQDAARKLIEE